MGCILALTLGLGFATSGWSRDSSPTRKQSAPDPDSPQITLKNHELPYFGFGSISILDDGFLLIRVGGEEIVDPESGNWEGETPSDLIGLQVNTGAGWGLVQSGRELFLDRNDEVETIRRGLKGDQANHTTFRQKLAETDTVFALHHMTGLLSLSFDATAGTVCIVMDDSNHSGLRLSVDEAIGTAYGTAVAGNGSFQFNELAKMPDEGIALLQVVTDPSVLAANQSAYCTVTCSAGECSVTCTTGGCRAACRGSNPECTCL